MEFSEQTGSQGCVAQRRDSPGQLWAASSELAFCEQFIGQLRLLEHDQTIRDSGDVCGARNTQFEQEFLGLFLGETMSAYDWRDRVGDFCVADYLAEHYTVHVVRYSTRFTLHLRRTSSSPPMITRAREGSPPPRQRVSQNSYAVIIREICSQLVGQGRCEHVVCAASQKRLASAMYHVSAFRPRACHRSHVCVCVWAWLQLAFRVCRCADSILSDGTRRRFRTSLSFDSVQMSHLVGSNCHGFTPLR